MLETLGQTNIGNINLQEPQTVELGHFFDPRREISQAEWENMKKFLYSLVEVPRYVHYAGLMRTLFPERVGELLINEDRRLMVDFIHANRVRFGRDASFDTYAWTVEMIADSLVFFPEKRQDLESEYRELKRDSKRAGLRGWFNKFNIYSELGKNLDTYDGQNFIADLATISREDLEAYPKLEEHKKNWLHSFAEIPNDLLDALVDQDVLSAARYRLTFPDERFDFNKVYSEFLKEMRNPKTRVKDYRRFTDIAYSLAVLSAQDIKQTDNGVELIFPGLPDAITAEIPALPETRKF